MISLTDNTITPPQSPGEPLPITAFEVWFQTPVGLSSNLETAVSRCQELDLEPELAIKPVAVAVHSNLIYEVL